MPVPHSARTSSNDSVAVMHFVVRPGAMDEMRVMWASEILDAIDASTQDFQPDLSFVGLEPYWAQQLPLPESSMFAIVATIVDRRRFAARVRGRWALHGDHDASDACGLGLVQEGALLGWNRLKLRHDD